MLGNDRIQPLPFGGKIDSLGLFFELIAFDPRFGQLAVAFLADGSLRNLDRLKPQQPTNLLAAIGRAQIAEEAQLLLPSKNVETKAECGNPVSSRVT